MSDVYFLKEEEIYSYAPSYKSYSAILGYPGSKGRYNRQTKILTWDEYLISALVTGVSQSFVEVRFNRKNYVKIGDTRKILAPDPHGMSGGAIFSVEVIDVINPNPEAKLVGLAVEWSRPRNTITGVTAWEVVAYIKCHLKA